MTAVDRDPVTVAREVLDMNDARDYLATAGPLAVYSVGGERYAGLHVSEKIERRLLEAAPDLARAALRVDALADRLDHEAESRRAAGQDPFEVMTIRQEAARIRAALNGETDG